jgi:NAD(P)-dependent dehydrogenase (short-subunit alcohol dehydrogenase family)
VSRARMASFFITGASRGIGLGLTRQLLQSPPSQVGKVFASSRSDSSALLRDLVARNPDRAHHIIMATDDPNSVKSAAKEVQDILGAEGLDVLVNNAGRMDMNEGGIRELSPELLTEILDINLVGTQRTTATFMPLLEKGSLKKVINMFVIALNRFEMGNDIDREAGQRRWDQYHGRPSFTQCLIMPTRYPRPLCICLTLNTR